ncbi:sensor histidine kinase [Flavobacterium sp.]|uniref:sensor histidine kinase n=1 Tax=Flavobacterium sp. TaxID=239 RepID=UPI0039E5E7A5
MPDKNEEKEKLSTLHFTVDSALLEELGEKLVETVHIALVELVKNSYDADSTEVDIVFTTDQNGNDQIKVIDNGKGMNYEAIQNFWMRIATTNKEVKNTSTVFGRPLTGAKGIGRFSCRRLGAHLELISCGTKDGNLVGVQDEVERTTVKFPWKEFKAGTDVTEIECEGTREIIKNGATGTTLIISIISQEWNVRGWNWLKRQLSVLSANRGTRRKGFLDDPGFTIKIIAPDFEGGVRDVREDFINAGWGTLTAHINDKHQAVCKLEALGIGTKTFISNVKFPHLTDISLQIGIMVGDRSQMRNTSTVSLASMQAILPTWGGVQVRYRSFRVFPYGDDDWLNIDKDRGLRKHSSKITELTAFASTLRGVDPTRSLLNLLSMRSYLGTVEIGENATGFEMKLSREGFVDSPAIEELRDFVRLAIDWSTIYRDFSIREEARKQSQNALKGFEHILEEKLEPVKYIEAAVDYLELEVKNLTKGLPDDERQQRQENLLRATDVIKTHNANNQAELLHLRLIASTSTLLLIFSHEVKSLMGMLETSKNSLTLLAAKLDQKERTKVLEITSNFGSLKDRLNDLLQLTSLVGSNQKKAKPGQVALKNKIERVENVFALITAKYNIKIDYSKVPNNIAIKDILEAEVYSILLNVISNSIKSVIAAGKNRKIEIEAIREDGKNVIFVRDTGIGISKEKFEEVFIPFVSDPDNDLYDNLEKRLDTGDRVIVGNGSGLGLGIIREIVMAHSGDVKFIEPSKDWKAELKIVL